ncbi:MAG: site-2 protease family protein [Gammaproteobacteria bacterium]|nr:site-2 protease family protein [Gammaproteobacteria bacterium]MCB1926162.1 site-2 protease family protein [Gammaproteobacteria bacterium]
MDDLTLVQKIAVWALPLIFAVTVHEAAHGWVANKLGDPTARQLGRITLNPLSHIDPIGTLLVPLAMVMLTGFVIGWAKPVPVAVNRLRSPKRDMAIVAAAGPLSNLLMAFLWSLVLLLAQSQVHAMQAIALPLMLMAVAGVFGNVVLMAINLLPVPPLDGGRVLNGFLPQNLSRLYMKIEPYGMFILIALLISGAVGTLLGTVVFGSIQMLPGSAQVFGILPILRS